MCFTLVCCRSAPVHIWRVRRFRFHPSPRVSPLVHADGCPNGCPTVPLRIRMMPVTNVFAGITVRDRGVAIEFYERLLGTPPTMLPNDDEAAWQLTGGGWLYV